MHQFFFQHLIFGLVFDQQNQAAAANVSWLVDCRLVQAEPLRLAFDQELLLMHMRRLVIDKTAQQLTPGSGQIA